VLLGATGLLVASALGFGRRWQMDPWLAGLIGANTVAFAWRAGVRFAFTAREYGWVEGLWAVGRIPVANAIAIAEARAGLEQSESVRDAAIAAARARASEYALREETSRKRIALMQKSLAAAKEREESIQRLVAAGGRKRCDRNEGDRGEDTHTRQSTTTLHRLCPTVHSERGFPVGQSLHVARSFRSWGSKTLHLLGKFRAPAAAMRAS
jgi:hypothetical protein